MMFGVRELAAVAAACVVGLLAHPAGAAPAGGGNDASGASLDETLAFIKARVLAASPVRYSAKPEEARGRSVTMTYGDFNVASRCVITWNAHTEMSGVKPSDATIVIDLATAHDIAVKDIRDAFGASSVAFTPQLPALSYRAGGRETAFLLSDQADAHRIATAMTQAAELCHQGSGEPF